MNKYYYLPGGIATIAIVIFLIPNSIETMSFSGIAFLAGEMWRILTFPFVHTHISHLSENIITLAATSILALLAGFQEKEFAIIFFGAGILIALAETIFFPTIVIAGLSIGIFATLGAIAARGTDYVPHYILIAVLTSSLFFKYFILVLQGIHITQQILGQTGLHVFGFISGIAMIYIIGITITKKRVLTA